MPSSRPPTRPSQACARPERRSVSEPAVTEGGAPPPFILTLTLDDSAFAFFDRLRRQHYPAERNHVPAHLTLFHTLPGSEGSAIGRSLDEIARRQPPIRLQVTEVKRLGSAVAFSIASEGLASLRRELSREWEPWLTAQDRQGFRPHVTVHNKGSAAEGRAAHDAIASAFRPFEATGVGLQLWAYLGGPWRPVRRWRFGG